MCARADSPGGRVGEEGRLLGERGRRLADCWQQSKEKLQSTLRYSLRGGRGRRAWVAWIRGAAQCAAKM